MNTPDLITIIGNISRSLYPIQHLITGGAYVLGILFFITAIAKLRKIADTKGQSSHEKMYAPMMYLLFGAFLLYLPTVLNLMANTTFGTGNIISYSAYNSSNIYSSMGLMIQTAGIIYFVRGCVLVVQSSDPGTQFTYKGLSFIFAGILAMNFDNTIAMLNYTMGMVVHLGSSIKSSQGY